MMKKRFTTVSSCDTIYMLDVIGYVDMINDYVLTQNEMKALVLLVKNALLGCGGEDRGPEFFREDAFTWCDSGDLIGSGWTRHEGAGTYSALSQKGLIVIDSDGDYIDNRAWEDLIPIWNTVKEIV
jgi:hypothetical protein